MTEQIDGDDIRHVFLRRESDAGAITSAHVAQAPDGAVRLSTPEAQNRAAWIDDFGRMLRVALLDHGTKTAGYDAVGRITEIRQADGRRIEFTYDLAGRLTGKRLADREGTTESHTVLRHDGLCLTEVADPALVSRYELRMLNDGTLRQ